jgi:CheY-like chemotaxis protein
MNAFREPHAVSPHLIYLVDDEQLMLDLAEVALLGKGYDIRKFSDPAQAFAAFASEPAKPSLLLTDFAMTPLNGLELSEKCREACPDLKILMLSGSITEEVATRSPVRLDGFIAKPYQPSTLAQRVETLLGPEGSV